MKAFITVIGHDTVGVVAKVAGLCTELNINIEDVTQSILQGIQNIRDVLPFPRTASCRACSP